MGSTTNAATAATDLTVTGTTVTYGLGVTDGGFDSVPFGDEAAVFGHAKATAFLSGVMGYGQGNEARGVHGYSDQGTGILGESDLGTGIMAKGNATGAGGLYALSHAGVGVTTQGQICALQLQATVGNPPPNSRTDAHQPGELDLDANGTLWACIAAGSPGTWVRLASSAAAGAFSVLPASVHVYDSRPALAPTTVGPKAPLTAGTARTVDMTANSSGVPATARAVLINLTGVPSSPAGFLSAYRAGIAFPGTSTLNWSAAGNPVANAAVVALGGGRINLVANAATDVVVDAIGYYE